MPLSRFPSATLAGVCAAALLAGAALIPAPALASEDPVVAVVEGIEIPRSRLETLQAGLPQDMASLPLEAVYDQLLDYAINLELLAAQARAEGVGDSDLFQRRMETAETRILFETLIDTRAEAEITDAAVEAEYDRFVASRPAEEEILARHILVESQAEASALIAELDGGADFEALAREHSTGPSAAQGGSLGYFPRGRMVQPFNDAAFALETGAYTAEPVQTQFGWHVILVEDRRDTAPPPLEAVRQQMEEVLLNRIYTDAVDEVRAGAAIEKFSIDGSAR